MAKHNISNGIKAGFGQKLRLPAPGTALKLLNAPASKECLGIGFLAKDGVKADCLNRSLPVYVLVLVLRGQGSYVDSEGRVLPVAAGQAFQRLPWVSHSNYVDPDSKWFECYLSCGPALYQAMNAMLFLPGPGPIFDLPADQTLVDRLAGFRKKLLAASPEQMPEMASALLELFAECRRLAKPGSGETRDCAIRKATALLSKDFRVRVDLHRFCRENGCGYENFRKLFERATGMPPGRFRVVRRLEAASAMLRSGKFKVSEIAETLGYDSPYGFSLQFKKYFGASPTKCKSS